MQQSLATHRIVLLGIGHTNAHVLKMWRMYPLPDAELVCVNNFPIATYSGMLPGVLSGQYEPGRMEIDLVRLCAANQARLILDQVVGLDRERRELLFADRPPLPYDALSVGIGSVPRKVPGVDAATHVLAIKPMQTFRPRLRAALAALSTSLPPRPIRIAIVGGGAGGVEIACCLPGQFEPILGGRQVDLRLVHGGPHILEGMRPKTVNRVLSLLQRRGVRLEPGSRVTRVEEQRLCLEDGSDVAADLVIWATTAVAPPLLSDLGLPVDERGFLLTRATLQSTADERIFAVGDSGTVGDEPRPKSGVFAVRHGPILWQNLGHLLAHKPLITFRPQREFLKLLNLGDGTAVGEWRHWTFQGRWVWRWKDHIDTNFMKMYQDYRPMSEDEETASQDLPAMRCLGCGGKVASSVLSSVLQELETIERHEVLQGLSQPDDAAVLDLGGQRRTVVTTDFFAAPLDDDYVSGRIAALNALSDAWAMGAEPLAALTMATIPTGSERGQRWLLQSLLAGALREFRQAHTALVGGHTIEGPRTTIGFTIIAQASAESTWQKSGLQADDTLLLTKPIGTGILLAAHMQARCQAAWYLALVKSLLTSNQVAAEIGARFELTAATDITGFGLAGHLLEMLTASRMHADLRLDAIPLLPGAAELAAAGVASTLAPANRRAGESMQIAPRLRQDPRLELLFDPQTSGGMLFAAPGDRWQGLERALQEAGVPVAMVGHVRHAAEGPVRLNVI